MNWQDNLMDIGNGDEDGHLAYVRLVSVRSAESFVSNFLVRFTVWLLMVVWQSLGCIQRATISAIGNWWSEMT